MNLLINHTDYLHDLRKALWDNDGSSKEIIIYALLDGASSNKIFPMLKQSGLRFDCLYEGKLSYDMQLSAPYLVRLDEDSDFTHELLLNNIGNNWCVFFKTFKPVTMLSILRLARRNHKILTPDNKQLIFRYFDPRILRSYIPSCTIKEANVFFGPIEEIICEGSEPCTIHKFSRTDHGVLDLNVIDLQKSKISKEPYENKIGDLKPLKIRQEQLNILSKSMLPPFFKKISEYVINEYPEFALHKKDKLMSWVEETYNQAIEYGLKTERDHYKFVNYKCIFGNDFMEAYDFAAPIMKTSAKPGLKLVRLKDAFMDYLNS